MNIIDVNKELYRIAKSIGLKLIDDVEGIQSKTLWLEDINVLKGEGNKNYSKKVFYVSINLYEVDNKKTSFYEKSEELLNALKTDLFPNTEYSIKFEIKNESSRKVSTDVAKFYQYSIDFYLHTYRAIEN
ncbi:MAG: hypothetical protein MSA15_21270 [Clostridium sp.]|nr:hypothetical protein [Clostridium sp.]